MVQCPACLKVFASNRYLASHLHQGECLYVLYGGKVLMEGTPGSPKLNFGKSNFTIEGSKNIELY